jgi:hypothetical protein
MGFSCDLKRSKEEYSRDLKGERGLGLPGKTLTNSFVV